MHKLIITVNSSSKVTGRIISTGYNFSLYIVGNRACFMYYVKIILELHAEEFL